MLINELRQLIYMHNFPVVQVSNAFNFLDQMYFLLVDMFVIIDKRAIPDGIRRHLYYDCRQLKG